MNNFILFESATGLFLFKIIEYDPSASVDKNFISSIEKFASFNKIVNLEAIKLFTGHNVAKENIQEILNGDVSKLLKEFLKSNLPLDNLKKISLIIQDKNLASNINKKLKINCITGDQYLNLFRGVRLHLQKYIQKEDDNQNILLEKASLGLGHAIAREVIQFDEKRQDKSIINSYNLLNSMEKNLNSFSMRAKEWYGWHFPELDKIIPDNELYVRLVNFIGNRENLSQNDLKQLEDILEGDGETAKIILERSKISYGQELMEVDEESLKSFTEYIIKHYEFKKNLSNFLKNKMEEVSPNLTKVLGEVTGAKLLTQAGGLNNLSKLPASTIQILGAEKALFRSLKKKSPTPKYGLLYNSSYISKANSTQKGKISRYLANKCAMASRLDQFLKVPSDKFGTHFKNQLNEKLVNIDKKDEDSQKIMNEIVQELEKEGLYKKKN